jgi:hypothetical protein
MTQIANLVHQSSATTGTGSFTLAAINGKETFANAFGTGDTNLCFYFISNRGAAEWEQGIGYMSDSTTLVRDTVQRSSNSDNAVNFSAGTKDVTNALPEDEIMRKADYTLTANLGALAFDDDAGDVPFTPAGNIAATNVQAAIEELDTEKQDADADLTSWASVTRASGFDAWVASPTVANLAALLTDEPFTAAIGGTGNAFTQFTGPTTSAKTFTLPNSSQALACLDLEDQTLAGGARVTSKSLGTVTTGTLTPDPGDRPMQHYTNGGAHTLAPGSNVGNYLLDIVNNGSAGAITTSGWTKVSGDSFTTTNGHKFRCHASVGQEGSLLVVQALQ